MPDRVDSDIDIVDNDEIIRPHAMPVNKELVLDTVGHKATLQEDNVGHYDPHITSITFVTPETATTRERTKWKGLYPHLVPPTSTLSLKGNPIDVTFSQQCGTLLYTDQNTGECFVNTWDGV